MIKIRGVMKKIIPLKFWNRNRHLWHELKSYHVPIIEKFKWHLNKPKLPTTRDNTINLHLGCGEVNHPDFINIDLVPHTHVHYVRPIDDLSIFANESVDLIYASHCLEHFPYRKVPSVLVEWARVLKKGGILRLSVPDFDTILGAYEADGKSLDLVLEMIVGGQDYEYNFHYVVFNKKYLKDRLERTGLSGVSEWTPGSSSLTTFDDWSNKEISAGGKTFPISLNLEARK